MERVRPALAGLVVAAGWLPALAAAGLIAAGDGGWEAVGRLIVTALVYAPTAAVVVLWRRGGVALILAALAIGSGAAALAIAAHAPGDVLRAAVLAGRLAEIAALAILPWQFLPQPARGVGTAVGVVAIAADAAMSVLGGGPLLLSTAALALTSFPLAAVLLVRDRLRRSRAEREALAWFLTGAVLLVLSYLRLVAQLPPFVVAVNDVAFVLAQGLLPTGLLALVFAGSGVLASPRLVDGLVWAQSAAVAIGVYLLVVAVALQLGAPVPLSGAIAAGILALVFTAMLRVVRRQTARAFFGPGADVRAVLAALGDRIDTTLGGVASSLRDVWHLRAVELEPRGAAPVRADGPLGTGAPPRPGGAPALLERTLTAAGRPVCTLRLAADDPAVLHRVVAPMLDEVGPLIAVAVLLAEANDDVAAARRRAAEVQREERRLLHRELHDELAPALAGIGFGMAGARRLIAAGAPSAGDAVERLRADLAERAEHVRRLARAMLPAALDAGDLEGALRELDRRFAGLDVDVRARGTDDLDAHTQVAVYLVAADVLDALAPVAPVGALTLGIRPGDGGVGIRLGPVPPDSVVRAEIARRCADAGGAARFDADDLCVEVPR